ncbi:MAG: hypothetical protein AAFU53_12565 [Cyanobacteria bacterium J06632_3]
MAISLSLYDFFAHLIPGGVALAAFLFTFQPPWFEPSALASLGTPQLLGIALLSYVLGYVVDPIGNRWYRVFRQGAPRFQLSRQAAKKVCSNYPNVAIDENALSWYTLLAYIKRHNLPMAQEIEQFNVTHIMLRGISFGVLMFAGGFCFKIFTAPQAWKQAIFSLLSMAIAYILMQEAIKFRIWFYHAIYQSVVALTLKPEQLPVKYRKMMKSND